MNINEMSDQEKSDQEKSVMLARLCGWEVEKEGNVILRVWEKSNHNTTAWEWSDYQNRKGFNLYAPKNMSLARHVLNWANKSGLLPDQSFVDQLAYTFTYAKDGLREALDMVLTLAIDGGAVEGGE